MHELIIRKVAADEADLDGDQWLQLATALCDLASGPASLAALELILSGPASRFADEIGEGPLRPDQLESVRQEDVLPDVLWHLLGDSDAYIRWSVARGISDLVHLGLVDDVSALLARFDLRSVPALASNEHPLSFQNSQQWLLMGLARAAWKAPDALASLRPPLLQLARRDDVHIVNKTHLLRALANIDGSMTQRDVAELRTANDEPAKGIVVKDSHPKGAGPATTFSFDYEFNKTEISRLARRFNIPEASVVVVMEKEIIRLWPDATSMDFFPGRSRYQWDLSDRYELYCEHVQRHALLSAATALSKRLPVVIRSYEGDEETPWIAWRDRYDVTFDDGSWLSDRKDRVPPQASENFLGERIDRQDTLKDQDTILRQLGFSPDEKEEPLPIYGRWTAPEGVTVSITSALTDQKGAIGRCAEFIKRPAGDFWLPEFWDGGYYDRGYVSRTPSRRLSGPRRRIASALTKVTSLQRRVLRAVLASELTSPPS